MYSFAGLFTASHDTGVMISVSLLAMNKPANFTRIA